MSNTSAHTRDFSVVEVCAMLNVSAPTVYKMLNRGDLDSYLCGRSRRIVAESIDRLRSGNKK